MRVYNIFEELLAFPSCCDLVWSSFLPILILSCWSSRLFLVCPSRLQSPVSSPSFFPFLVSFLPFSPLPPSEELSSSYPSSFLLSSLFLPCFLFLSENTESVRISSVTLLCVFFSTFSIPLFSYSPPLGLILPVKYLLSYTSVLKHTSLSCRATRLFLSSCERQLLRFLPFDIALSGKFYILFRYSGLDWTGLCISRRSFVVLFARDRPCLVSRIVRQ